MSEAIKKNGVSLGIVLSVFLVLRTAIMYLVDLKLFVNGWIGLVDFVVIIVIGCIAIARAKKELGGFINFKEAFTTFFISSTIGLTIYTLFTFILFNFVDPEAKETVKTHLIEYTVNMMQKFGGNSEMMKASLDSIKNDDMFSLGSQLQGLLVSIIIYTIVGLIVAVAFKNKARTAE